MSHLKISVSGIRGIVGETLTYEVAVSLGKAFGTVLKDGMVVIGRDTRPSGEFLMTGSMAGLCATGCEPIDLGIVPTPTVSLALKKLGAKGGIVITASHNPIEWNGLKFFRHDGMFLSDEEMAELIRIWGGKNFSKIKEEDFKKPSKYENAIDDHVSLVLDAIDKALIRKRKFKVAIDPVNGAGSLITTLLLKDLGCEIVSINTDTSKAFAHAPEPVGENLKDLCALVKREKANIGIAQDPDGDRLSIVSEKGEAIGEENTLALAIKHILTKEGSKNIVVNLSTSRVIDDIAAKFKTKVLRTKIGEFHVATKMKEIRAMIGGEGNGGIIYPKVSYNRDSIVGIGIILECLASSKKTLSELAEELPKYFLVKEKVALKSMEDSSRIIDKTKDIFKSEHIDTTDGVKINFSDSWLQVRASNTEPILRIFAEANSREKAEELILDLVKRF